MTDAEKDTDEGEEMEDLPSYEDLLNPKLREEALAKCAVRVASGKMKSKEANAFRALCKEIRDNTDIRGMTAELYLYRKKMKEVLHRKSSISLDEIEQIFARVYQGAYGD